MGITVEGQVGPRYVADGANTELRLGRNGELVCADAHGRYYEAGYRGKLFSASTAVAGVTLISEMASLVAANKQTVLSVYNPVQSGVIGILHRIVLVNISGTPGAGNGWALEGQYGQTLTTQTNNLATAGLPPTAHYPSASAGQLVCFTALATGTTGADVLLRPLPFVSFATALAATTPNLSYVEDVNGEIAIPPGAIITIAPPALGTTHVVVASMSWEEVPL